MQRSFAHLPFVHVSAFRGGRGVRHLSIAGLVTALVLLAFAVAGLWPATAHAGTGAADTSFWPIWGAAALQMGIAIVVGLVQASQARLVRLNDERVEALRQRFEAEINALRAAQTDLDSRLRTTREDYARRSDVDAAIGRLETEIRGLRTEFRDMASHTHETQLAVQRVLALLDPPKH